MELYIKSKTNDAAEWLELPVTEEELEDFLSENNIGEEYEIAECDEDGINIDLDDDVLEVSEAYERIESYEYNKVLAIMEYESNMTLIEAVENVDNYSFYPDVKNDYDLGYYWLVDSGCYDVPDFLENYIDFEQYGADNYNGEYTSYGYIE